MSEVTTGDLGARIAEMLRRATVVVSVLWFGLTAFAATMSSLQTPSEYTVSPHGNALAWIGGSLVAYATLYLLIKAGTWVFRGIRKSVAPLRPLVGAGTISAGLSLLIGGATISAAYFVYKADEDQSEKQSWWKADQPIAQPAVQEPSQAELLCRASKRRLREYNNTIITQEEFQSVKLGMTYRQIVEAIGAEGRELSARSLGGSQYNTYSWTNGEPPGGSATLDFEDGKLTAKTPYRLPAAGAAPKLPPGCEPNPFDIYDK